MEQTAPRTIEKIQEEYTAVCAAVGDLTYKIDEHKKTMSALDQEFKTVSKVHTALKEVISTPVIKKTRKTKAAK